MTEMNTAATDAPRGCAVDELAILRRDSDEPTDEYRALTGELYLNF